MSECTSVDFLTTAPFNDPLPEQQQDYLATCVNVLRNCPTPEILLSVKEISTSSVNGTVGVGSSLKMLNEHISRKDFSQRIKHNISAHSDLGFHLKQNKIVLTPVDIAQVLKRRGQPPILCHYGYTLVQGSQSIKLVDNIEQIKEKGIYGDTRQDLATYINRFLSPVVPHLLFAAINPLILYIDPVLLFKYRFVFSDP